MKTLKDLAAQYTWQPIETAPRDGTIVLRQHKVWGVITVRHIPKDYEDNFTQGWRWANHDCSIAWPDYAFLGGWMPLPSQDSPTPQIIEVMEQMAAALMLISATAILQSKGIFEKSPSRLDAVGTIKENRRLARQALAAYHALVKELGGE